MTQFYFNEPARLTLVSLHGAKDDAQLQAQFNPEELSMGIKAAYKDQAIPGMSHQLKQFSHTENITLKFQLKFQVQDARRDSEHALAGQTRTPLEGPHYKRFSVVQRENAERFLLSLCVPRGEMLITRNMPPTVLVLWPNFLTFEGVVETVDFKYTRFNRQLTPIEMTADIAMEQIRDVRFTNEGARRYGQGFKDESAAKHAADVLPHEFFFPSSGG